MTITCWRHRCELKYSWAHLFLQVTIVTSDLRFTFDCLFISLTVLIKEFSCREIWIANHCRLVLQHAQVLSPLKHRACSSEWLIITICFWVTSYASWKTAPGLQCFWLNSHQERTYCVIRMLQLNTDQFISSSIRSSPFARWVWNAHLFISSLVPHTVSTITTRQACDGRRKGWPISFYNWIISPE